MSLTYLGIVLKLLRIRRDMKVGSTVDIPTWVGNGLRIGAIAVARVCKESLW